MDLPFTRVEFFQVFRAYNETVWPIQWVWFSIGLAALFSVRNGTHQGSRAMLLVLSALWLWMGIVYHGMFFRAINPAATLFAGLFVVQAVLLFVHAVRGDVVIRPSASRAGITGWLIVGYGLVVYPVVGAALGHRYPTSPTFGLPCPTTLYTLGVLIWMRPHKWSLYLIPIVWAVIGTGAALKLSVYEDFGLAVAVVAAVLVVITRRRTADVSAGVSVLRHADATRCAP